MDRKGKLLAVGPLMIISKSDHDDILSDHIHLHRIKHESMSLWIELDKIEFGYDAPRQNNWTSVRVSEPRDPIISIPVEAHIVIC